MRPAQANVCGAMTPSELQAIAERAANAESGPWKTDGETIWGASNSIHIAEVAHGAFGDAEFIAHARTDIPRLLEEVQKLTSICERLASAVLVFAGTEPRRDDLRTMRDAALEARAAFRDEPTGGDQ
jgi:hypothetical protein